MAQKISDMTAASAVAGTNQIEINEAGTTKRITITQILDYITATLARINIPFTFDSNAVDTSAILTLENTAGTVKIFRTNNTTPEGVITANRGDICLGTTGDEGVIYVKHLGDNTNTGWKIFNISHYANLHIHQNAVVTNILTANVSHLVAGLFVEYITSDGFTFQAGSTGSITAFADAGSGNVTVTSAAHGMSNGDIISIAGTTNYNGVFTVANATTNTYTIVDTWVANDATGTWIKGDNLTVDTGIDGLYKVDFSIFGFSATNNKLFRWKVYKNATWETVLHTERIFATNDVGAMGNSGLIQLSDGDKITFAIENGTDTADFTMQHVSLTLVKISGA